MEFSPTLLAIVPPLLAILLAVITRQVVLSLFIAVFVGAVMLCGGNLWEGFYSTFFDYILPGFEDTDHQRILALTTFCGGLSLLLEKNGGAQAFANAVSRGAGKTRRGAQVLTWLGGVFVWFSDSTNPVLVGPICRSFTDKVKVSREKLAYIVDSTTAAVPTLFPISAWGAYIIGLIATFYTSTGYNGMVRGGYTAGLDGYLRMDYLPTSAVIRNQDQVVTSGSTVYPRDLVLGRIIDAGYDDTGVAKYAVLEPAVNVSSIEQVFVITEYDAG